ncbi:MAG: cytochrome o ubiquinol oxidase subunit III [Desulfobacterales bacterium]
MTIDATRIDAAAVADAEEPDIVANQAFGFWIYLMTDLVLFAALFAVFGTLAHNYAGGPTGKDLFHLTDTFKETMLLLFSSATFGMVILAVHENRKKKLLLWLMITFLLGLGFIVMEINEFYGLITDGNGPGRSAFISAYFTLVGTHGLHVTVGLVWMAAMAAQVFIKNLTTPVQSRLLRLSMFWHFLDIVWVGVFTGVYLRGVL